MRQINLENSPRKDHFHFFRTWDYPHFNMCANVEITRFYTAMKQTRVPFTVGLIYVLTRVANEIPEFRYRIHGETMVEHDLVHPGCTIMRENEMFTFCYLTYRQDFKGFSLHARTEIDAVKKTPLLKDPPTDHWLYMTSIPWVSFTSFMHPLQLSPADSIPRFAWGKFFNNSDRLLMPLSVQGHHAVMDGLHIGRFYAILEDYLEHPERFLSGG